MRMDESKLNLYEDGSKWRRWNPHIHAPGTLLNDQFKNDWEGYLKAIENSTPRVEVLGVTDYLSLESYKTVKAHKDGGRLRDVKLLFPNIEFRMTIATAKQKGINIHLLFCPNDDDHIDRIEHALRSITFEYKGSSHCCCLPDLMRLGKTHDRSIKEERIALETGANQFKVELDQLRVLFRKEKWVRDNCLVAVSSKSNDGTSGLQEDDGFKSLREEIETFSHLVFSSNAGTREFWLGKKTGYPTKFLEQKFGGRKACIHGCDAHDVAKTCQPDDNRNCWIKGDPTFDSLRQALLEPEDRVHIGENAPDRHDASQCIARLTTRSTTWLNTGEVKLNPGLVAIIGARGSGKTALADIIAIGANVTSPLRVQSSFIHRASNPVNYLDNAQVHLYWGDGTTEAKWIGRPNNDHYQTVRYLSQQFVDQLCSSAGLAHELRREIERVVFEATDNQKRMASDSFIELADLHLNPIRSQRKLAQDAISSTSEQVNKEEALNARIPAIKREQNERAARIRKIREELKTLVPKDKEKRAARLAELDAALTALNTKVERTNRAKKRVEDLRTDVATLVSTTLPTLLAKRKTDFSEAELTNEQWESFELIFKGDVQKVLAEQDEVLARRAKRLIEGTGLEVVDETPLEQWPLAKLKAARDKVKEEVGMDGQKQLRYNRLQQDITNDEKAQQKSLEELALAEGANARKQQLIESRRALYVQVFQSFLDEKAILEELYRPLHETLIGATGSLGKLRLSVSREIDLENWVTKGEALIDLRKDSNLRGQGSLRVYAMKQLLQSWRSGTAEQVAESMQEFIKDVWGEFQKAMPANITDANKSVWVQQVAAWLYSTEHIEMQYSITYDGVAIEHLSPGTRGIVLLLLYLVIDRHDNRPLIIDQPEENLDPKSVFDELVPHFREARKRRQVIIVTHNANLVVNTDADQVIVASSEANASGGLPTISYHSGSLENSQIRQRVCEILEGGEEAFRDRERRYRIQHDRLVQARIDVE